jgi:hypothetical protein
VNGVQLHVTRNLHAPLRRLRLESETRRVWVNALCINQDDPVEKSEQVQMMRDVCQQASRTLVWLGEGSEYTSRGFMLIPRLLNAWKLKRETGDDRSLQDLDSEALALYDIPRQFDLEWNNLCNIYDAPYFQRVWVIQEVAVSSNVDVFCGSHSISWNDLMDAVGACDEFGLEVHYDLSNIVHIGLIHTAQKHVRASGKWKILDLLVRYRSFYATDLRDKIYALLVLVDPQNLAETGIPPDYREEHTVEKVYADIAMSIFQTSKDLDLLSVPAVDNSTPSHLQLPSWVPDWSKLSAIDSLVDFSSATSPPPDQPSFSATKSSTSHAIFRSEGPTLGLHDYIVDQADGIGMVSIRVNEVSLYPSDLSAYSLFNFVRFLVKVISLTAENALDWMNWEDLTGVRKRKTYITGVEIRV